MAPSAFPLKIQDVHRKHRFGVVVKNIADLLTKASLKLQILQQNIKYLRVCLEEDGTEISDDDFLLSLPGNTVLVILQPSEVWMGNLNYIMDAFEQVKKIHPLYQVQQRIVETMNVEKDYEKMALISSLLASLDSKRHLESKTEDPEWFRDLPKKATSKTKVMENSAKSRVRSYFYDARRAVKAAITPAVYKTHFEAIFEKFTAALKKMDFYGGYFARNTSEDLRLCDAAGWFNCEGPFDTDNCSMRHLINPYDNKESRIVFSTWNLDHQVEKARQVIPALVSAVEKLPKLAVLNWEYFYRLLFTKINLRLVHVACHKKCEHTTKKVDETQHYVCPVEENQGPTAKSRSNSKSTDSAAKAAPGKRRNITVESLTVPRTRARLNQK